MNQLILVLDFGGQYKELIARKIRGYKVYSQIKQGTLSAAEIKKLNPIGIVLTGGPNSVYEKDSPQCDPALFGLGIPVLGICYGMQVMAHTLGGVVSSAEVSEYGKTPIKLDASSQLFDGVDQDGMVLMSHTDYVEKLPKGFSAIAYTENCPTSAMENPSKGLYAVQFHPETEHTKQGEQMLSNFLFKVCGAKGDYQLDDYLNSQIADIQNKVGKEKIILALSGGVDSSVCASLLSKAVPSQLICIFVDHGFMRQDEGDQIEEIFRKRKVDFIRVNAQKRFLKAIEGVSDPEKKRKIVGRQFIEVFEEEAKKLGDVPFLAQGTIYPDIIESGGEHTATIKSHHNVGGLPENLSFTGLVEPLSGLFKDEVRALGKKLGLPKALIERQPFPGPGLSIRVMGNVTEEKLHILRQADHIFCEEIEKRRKRPQQYFAVFTGVHTVGVMGDSRTYDVVIALRAVLTSDFMTCDYADIPHKTLSKIAARITNEVKGVSRIVYDITSKPPATVEWE